MKNGAIDLAALALTFGVALAGLAGFAAGSGFGLPSIRMAQAQSADAERQKYIREYEGRFEEWGRKLDAFNAKAAERGVEATQKARHELNGAWTDVKAGWSKLKSAGRQGWETAKEAFEASWRKLENAWHDAQS